MESSQIRYSAEVSVLKWRAQGVLMRAFQSALIGALAAALFPSYLLIPWFAVGTAVSILDCEIARLRLARPGSLRLEIASLASSFASSAMFASIGPLLASRGNITAIVAAILLGCAAALNNAVMTRGAPRQAWALVGPSALALLILPWEMAWIRPDIGLMDAGLMCLGALAYIVFITRLIRIMQQEGQVLRRALGVAEAANVAKSEFLATVSHEIRTPLNGVLGMAQAILRDDLSERQRERMRVLESSGGALLAILNDILDLSKIESGRLELEVADFDMETLASGAYAAFTAQANAQGLSVGFVVEPEARGAWRGDSVRVRQILYNLISNALKFTETGEVQVRVSHGVDGLQIEVRDTGVGIAAERLPLLFQKFVQADSSTTRKYSGTGLGLAICRELAQLMGGDIRVESHTGKGSTFTVRLPLPRAMRAPSPEPRPEPAPNEADPDCQTLRVLAAEDNLVNQIVLRTLLAQIGVEPTLAVNGAEALTAWRTAEFDLILMDVQMPVMDGLDAVRAIRAEEAARGRRRTPVVALTANAMTHQSPAYYEAGMDGVLAKPIQIEKLFEVLAEAASGPREDPSQATALPA